MAAGENPTRIPAVLWDALCRGQVVLTANQRGARALRKTFDQRMKDAHEEHWSAANVFALDTWLSSLWRQMILAGDETRLLLNRSQEHTLWHTIVASDRELQGLRSADALAEMAARAWHLLQLYDGQGRLHEFSAGTDTRTFQRWATEFDRRLHRASLLTMAQLAGALTAAMAEGTLPIPKDGLVLVDFDAIPPAPLRLLESIQAAGYPVDRVQTTVPSHGQVYAAIDAADELNAVAAWCRGTLETNPAARIAIVSPEIENRRAKVERILAATLAPQSEAITAPQQAPLFEFSLGRALASTAVCASSLTLLHWTLHPLSLDAIGSLLLSPFVGGAAGEALASADFDVHVLRRAQLLRPELTLDAFLDLARTSSREPVMPGLVRRLQAMRATALREHLTNPPATDRQTCAEWTDTFRSVLQASGWTAETGRDSLSLQAQARWESVLDEVATLDFDGVLRTSTEALEQVARIAAQTIFAPESRNAPVQILGALELGAVAFDALWFLGADDAAWPASASAHPFIPWAVQRSLGMPGADHARDQTVAQSLTNRIAGSATTSVFSFAQHGDEGARRLSPLLDSLALEPLILPDREEPAPPAAYEGFRDVQPVAPLPEQVIRGGATILQLQAACPFRAFAEKRLYAAEPESKDHGLDPRERGNVVHKVMESFWAEVRDQPSLKALSHADRHHLLGRCIDDALRRTASGARSAWETAYVQVQRERLHRLLEPWLEIEVARPPFAVQEHEKVVHDLQIGPLRLGIRVDRVDETEAGPLILDYKTGSAAPSEWLSERPDQPQLPLYAVLSGTQLGGVAFALLKPGKDLALKGFAVDATVFGKSSKMNLSMEEQVEDWRRVLTVLAQSFHEGDATVDPKCYPNTCQYCGQRVLCRLDVTTLDDSSDDELPSFSTEAVFG